MTTTDQRQIDLDNVQTVIVSKLALEKYKEGGTLGSNFLCTLTLKELEDLRDDIGKTLDEEELENIRKGYLEAFSKFFSPDTNIIPLYGHYLREYHSPEVMYENNHCFYLPWKIDEKVRNNKWAIFEARENLKKGNEGVNFLKDLYRRLQMTSLRNAIFSPKVLPYTSDLVNNYGIVGVRKDLKVVKYAFGKNNPHKMLDKYSDEPEVLVEL